MKFRSPFQANVYIYYAITSLGWVGFMVPVIYFYLVEVKALEAGVALFLIGLRSASASVFEITTGIVADKVSRKLSIAYGYLIKAAGTVALIFLPGLTSGVVGMILIGLGDSFVTGADRSILYDSLKQIDQQANFKKFLNTNRAIVFITVAATSALGGYLGQINLLIPVSIAAVSYLLAGLVGFLYTEPPTSAKGSELEQEGYLKHAWKSFKTVFSTTAIANGLTMLTIAMIIMEMIGKANKQIIPPLFENLGADVVMIGYIVSLTYITKAIGATIARAINKPDQTQQELYLGASVYIGSMLAIVLIPNFWVAAIAFSLAISFAPLLQSNFDQLINDRVSSHQRSTVLSIVSLSQNMISLGYVTVIGIMIGYFGGIAEVIWLKIILLGIMVFCTYFFFIQDKLSDLID